MKLIRLLLPVLVIGLTIFGSGLVHAQSEAVPEPETIKGFDGEVMAQGTHVIGHAGTLNIKMANTDEQKTILMTAAGSQPDYQLKTPGRSTVEDAASALKPGAGVAVLARQVDGEWRAVQVLVKPEQPTAAPWNGVVVSANQEDETFTIVTPSGSWHTLQLPATENLPLQGEVITVFVEPSTNTGDTAGAGDPALVRGLARASEVSERLQHHLEESASDGEASPGNNTDAREAQVELLAELMESHSTHQLESLNEVMPQVPDKSRDAIMENMADVKKDWRQAQAAVAEARQQAESHDTNSQDQENGKNNQNDQAELRHSKSDDDASDPDNDSDVDDEDSDNGEGQDDDEDKSDKDGSREDDDNSDQSKNEDDDSDKDNGSNNSGNDEDDDSESEEDDGSSKGGGKGNGNSSNSGGGQDEGDSDNGGGRDDDEDGDDENDSDNNGDENGDDSDDGEGHDDEDNSGDDEDGDDESDSGNSGDGDGDGSDDGEGHDDDSDNDGGQDDGGDLDDTVDEVSDDVNDAVDDISDGLGLGL